MNKSLLFSLLIASVSFAETLYTSDGVVYQGMSQATVQALLDAQGSTCVFVTKDVFDQNTKDREQAIEARIQPPPDPVKQQAILDAQNDKLDSQTRLNALLKVITLQ